MKKLKKKNNVEKGENDGDNFFFFFFFSFSHNVVKSWFIMVVSINTGRLRLNQIPLSYTIDKSDHLKHCEMGLATKSRKNILDRHSSIKTDSVLLY